MSNCLTCETAPPGSTVRVKTAVEGIVRKEPALLVERKLIIYAAAALLLLSLLQIVAYELFFKSVPNFLANYAPLVVLIVVAAVATVTGIFHFKSFKQNFSCMAGMMIGMTMGMLAGFMVGAIIGATNGMFIGSIAGMAAGILIGAWAGKCCGIMGYMEGLMAGVMGGTMGAMLSVMMLNDNLLLFLYIFFGSCVLIQAGLGYMMYKEEGENRKGAENDLSFMPFFGITIMLTALLMWLMLYGPKATIVWGV